MIFQEERKNLNGVVASLPKGEVVLMSLFPMNKITRVEHEKIGGCKKVREM